MTPTPTHNNITSSEVNWEDLGLEAKQLEVEIDGKLLQLGRQCSTALRVRGGGGSILFHHHQQSKAVASSDGKNKENCNSPSSSINPLQQAKLTMDEVTDALGRLSETIEAMASTINYNNPSSCNVLPASAPHILQRHRDIYQDYQKEYRKIKVHIVLPNRSIILKDHLQNFQEHSDLLAPSSAARSNSGAIAIPMVQEELQREQIDQSHNNTDHLLR